MHHRGCKFVIAVVKILITSTFAITQLNAMEPSANPEKHLFFATGFSDSDSADNNQLQLGIVTMSKGKGKVQYSLFDGRSNLRPTSVPVKHMMRAPYGGNECQNRNFDLPTPAQRRSENIGAIISGDRITIQSSEWVQHWERDHTVASSYTLKSMRSLDRAEDYQLAVGYAFLSNSIKAFSMDKSGFLNNYRGDIHHKDMTRSPRDNWEYRRSSLRLRDFVQGADVRTLELSVPGILKGRDNWAHNGILLQCCSGDERLLFHDYGHDFNRDGCFNEPGHNKAMLPARQDENGRIGAVVYVEYTFDVMDGFPMLSVGRYYE